MAWQTRATAGFQKTGVDNSAWVLFSEVEVTPGESVAIEVQVNNEDAGSPPVITDPLEIGIFPSLDGTNYQDQPQWSFYFTPEGGGDERSIFGWPSLARYFKIGVRCAGATDTYTVDAWVQGDNVSI